MSEPFIPTISEDTVPGSEFWMSERTPNGIVTTHFIAKVDEGGVLVWEKTEKPE